MAGARITFDDKEVRRALKRLAKASDDLSGVLADIGEHLLNSHRERFEQQRDPEGKPWKPLSPKYHARKRHNADKILILDSNLKDLLRYQVGAGGSSLELGTDRIYGATHQFGDEDRNIPARPFIGLSEADHKAVLDILAEHLEQALK